MVKALKVQRESFRTGERELSKAEYYRLLKAAGQQKRERLHLIIETLGATGIRISELKFITAEAVRNGCAEVRAKGKRRTVLLPAALCRKLKRYASLRHLKSGCLFVTRNGRPVDRSNVWREMKSLCKMAGVIGCKVFPHNLRHLFAVTYYKAKKDLSHLADLLGHSSINTTRIYTLISSTEQAAQIEELGLVV